MSADRAASIAVAATPTANLLTGATAVSDVESVAASPGVEFSEDNTTSASPAATTSTAASASAPSPGPPPPPVSAAASLLAACAASPAAGEQGDVATSCATSSSACSNAAGSVSAPCDAHVEASVSASTYPVSTDGTCPTCSSNQVVYLVLKSLAEQLTPTLSLLLGYGYATWVEDADGMPSFQCCQCGYGFNLDWTTTSLETIYHIHVDQLSGEAMFTAPVLTQQQTEYQQQQLQQQTSHSLEQPRTQPSGGFQEYVFSGRFNSMSGRFQAHTSEEHFETRGLHADRELRQMSRWFDPAELTSDTSKANWKERPKLTKKQIAELKERKKQRKMRKKTQWLQE
eukprot:m.129800 g.129800  ORF g.129800 m.129800 type:complete len:343 (-) comp16768_c0_seq4:2073-3101(-)